MTSKRPSLKERVFEKLGTRFRTSNEDLHKTDSDQEAANSHSEKKQATTSATVWYTHPTEEGERSDSGSKQQVVTLEPVRQESMVDNIATEKKEKKQKKMKPPGTKEYTVRETDTLSSIAAFYDTTPSALTKLNKLMTRYIYPGQILYVPDPDSDEEETGANTQDAEILGASPERPTMDVPLIKMADRPPAKIPGHVERIPTPLSSPTKSSEFVLPHKLTEEEVESLDQECYERFIKVNVKHITDGQGVVSGVLLVTPNAVMFDPNVSDPLVLEHGAENYGVIAPMDMVVSAAMYHDIAAAMRIRGQRDNDNDVTKSEVYHDKSCQLYKSWCEGHRIPSNLYLNPENLSDKSEQNPAITSPQSENGSVCSCSANQSMASPDIANHSDSVFESANQNHFDIVTKTASKDSKAENSKIGNADLTSVGPMELTSANEFGEFVSADDTSDIPLGQHLSQTNSLANENLSNTDSFVSNQGINLQSGIDDRLGGNGRVDVTAEDGKQVPNKGEICDTNKTTFYCGENELTSAEQGEVTPSESADCDTQQKMRIGNIVYLPIKDGSHGRASLKDLETAQSTLSKLSFDEFEQKARSHSTPVDIPLVRSSEKNSDSKIAETKSSGSLGSFNMTPHLSAFVNYASGLFKTGSSVKDINDVLPGNEDKDSDVPDSKSEQKADSSMPSKHGKSGKDSDGKSDLEVAVESAVKLADKPELFQSFDKLIPKPATNYEDPPLYLSLRLGTPINKNVSQTCPIQAYSRKKKKPEYWFSIPRDKVDQLYAFFVQWKPEIYGDDEEMTAEKRGFVILDEDAEKLPDVMSDMYDEHFTSTIASLQKDWEIISTEESMRRKSTDVDDVILLPELIGESTIMEDFHLQMINKHMPARTVGYPWTLIYSTDLHGFSLKTLYRHMASVDSPSLLVVRDSNDFIFGAMTSCKLRPSDHFYGTGESFLFTFYPEFKVFRWTGENNFFNKGNQESLAIGAGQGQFGLWFDGDIYHGRTKRCETYDNDILTSAEDFVVKTFEAWVFTQEYSC